MGKPILVWSSDNHLAPHAWASRPDLSGDSYCSFEQTVDYCLMHDLPLLLGGDVLDRAYPDARTVRFLLTQLARLDMDTFFIQGQHELDRSTPWLGVADRARHVHRRVFEVDVLTLYGLDFQPASSLQHDLRAIPPGVDVLVAHQVWAERMGLKDHQEGSFKDVPVASCILTGDFHAHSVQEFVGADGQKLVVASPGSQCMQNITEDPDKYFFVMHDDLTFESVKLVTRRREWFTLRNAASFADDLAGIVADADPDEDRPFELQKPIFVVKFSDDIPDARNRIRSALATRVHLFDQPIEPKRHRESEDYTSRVRAASLGLGGRLEADYRESDPAVYSTAKRLLEAKDLKAETSAVIDEVMKGGLRPDEVFTPRPDALGVG